MTGGGACLGGIDWSGLLLFLAVISMISSLVILILSCCVNQWGNINNRSEGLLLAIGLGVLAVAMFVAANQAYARFKFWEKKHSGDMMGNATLRQSGLVVEERTVM